MSAGDVTEAWAKEQVTALLPDPVDVPEYGSLVWLRLPADDPRRPAALITAAEMWRRYGGAEDLAAWLADANAPRPPLHELPSGDELAARRTHLPARPVQAAPGWPVAIPGRPGWWRHNVDGRQVDRPAQLREAA